MGMTIVEKILARAGGVPRVAPGEFIVVNVDTVVLIDNNFAPLYWRDVLKVADPGKIVVAYDHRVPPPDKASAQAQVVGRAFVERFGIKRFHDIGRNLGISHVVVADNAYALPGTVLVCSDTHTGSGGAFNCAARGVGGPDIVYAAIKGETWFRVYPTIRYDIVGKLNPGVTAKDVFLSLANTEGDHAGHNIEFGGPGVAGLRLDARRTIAAMCTELNAEFAIFEADDVVLDYVRQRNATPFHRTDPDADASYADRRTLDLGKIEILVAKPDTLLNNAVPVGEVAGVVINQGFIGSCANGNLDDLEIAARVLSGRRVAAGVRLLVTPGSQEVYRQALKAGYIETLLEAGALITNPTCGACSGGHMGLLGANETCITASTRNNKGRMGDPSARIYMGSPATVAASAITGVITDPGAFLTGAAS
jgi:3-isopropylmalate/(R)-2-methylmalate dehydratase large subunit